MRKELESVVYNDINQPRSVRQLSSNEFRVCSVDEQLTYIAALAHLAPSSHNTQPWRFALDEKKRTITVYLNRTSVLPASDITGRQAVISVGCSIAHMLLVGEFYGMSPVVKMHNIKQKAVRPLTPKLHGSKKAFALLSTIHFKKPVESPRPSSATSSEFHAILLRKVVRAEFDASKSIPDTVIFALKKIANTKNTKLHVITDSARRSMLAELQAQADGFVINDPAFTKELGVWLLPNDTTSRVGIPGIGFGLQDQEALRLHRGLAGIAPLEPEDGLKFAIAGKRSIETSPAICLLTIKKDDPASWLDAGRVFEQMFLSLMANDIQVAIHAGIVEVPLINRMFAATLGIPQQLAVLFRIGLVKDPRNLSRPYSPRLPLSAIMI